MARERMFRKKDLNITDHNAVLLGDLVVEESQRLANMERPKFFVRFVEDTFDDQQINWDELFSNLAARSIARRLFSGKMKAYAVSDDGSEIYVVSKKFWKAKDNTLNYAAVSNRVLGATFGDDVDHHTPRTIINPIDSEMQLNIGALVRGLGFKLYVAKTDLDGWKRRSELSVDGLKWDKQRVQDAYDHLSPDLQAKISDSDLWSAAKGSGITVKQIRGLQRSTSPSRGPKSGRDK